MISTLIALALIPGADTHLQIQDPQQGNTIPITNNNNPPPPGTVRGRKPTWVDCHVSSAVLASLWDNGGKVRLVVDVYGPHDKQGKSLVDWGGKDVIDLRPASSVEKFGQKYSNAEYTIRLKALPDTRARMEKVQVTATFLVFGKGGTRQGVLVDKREVQLYIPKKR